MSKRLYSSLNHSICASCQRRILSRAYSNTTMRANNTPPLIEDELGQSDVLNRIRQLGGTTNLPSYYPRLPRSSKEEAMSAAHFSGNFKKEAKQRPVQLEVDEPLIKVYGRVTAIREHGSKLAFISLHTPGTHSSRAAKAQIMLSLSRISKETTTVSAQDFKDFRKTVQRGDWIAVRGRAGETESGQWSLIASEIPQILSPSLKTVPEKLEDVQLRMNNRHIDHIVNPSSLDVLFLRHKIMSNFRQFFTERNFVEVSTPLLVANAGGASARPFETRSSDVPDAKISLRIATELFLKRLIVGGMQRIFEIGAIFRNEGVDHTHNPEFTMCEFYATMMSLWELMAFTEDLFRYLAKATDQARTEMEIPALEISFDEPFAVLDFIPSLEEQIRIKIPDWSFPDLACAEAIPRLIKALETFDISLPSPRTVPRLLDALASHLLESQSSRPTFIIHYPECMSPLSKSFELSHNGAVHRVAARAELFINGREYVNMYEEENSPIEQRRKFVAQLDDRGADEGYRTVDENYLKTMEWGLPPTGGWGAGIDRIVMLFAGKKRIADVLAFGTLRNVVAMGSGNNVKKSDETH